MERFSNRAEAGRILASALGAYAAEPDVVVLGLPRGGVPVAFEVAKALQAPLDVFVVRKLGVPMQPELAMGAIASGDVRVLNEEVTSAIRLDDEMIEQVAARELAELERREEAYRKGRPRPQLTDKVAILVDDGLATGSTMRAAVAALRQLRPSKVVVAVPTGSSQACDLLAAQADEVVCVSSPEPYHAVGMSYEDFSQTTDEEVGRLLTEAADAGWRRAG